MTAPPKPKAKIRKARGEERGKWVVESPTVDGSAPVVYDDFPTDNAARGWARAHGLDVA